MRIWILAAICVAVVTVSTSAVAQEFVPEESTLGLVGDEEAPEGWTHTVEFGAGFTVATSRDVVGQNNGTTFTVSLNFGWDAELLRGNHEYRNEFSIEEAFSRTPLIDEFVKSRDELRTESIYFYHLPKAQWLGPFARAVIRTSIFPGYDVRADPTPFLITRSGGTQELEVRRRLQLTGPFAPLTFKESVGMFMRPVSEDQFTFDLRFGLGGREVFANGNFIVDDNEDTETVREIRELESYAQVGSELAAVLAGVLMDGSLTYGASFEMMTPFYDSLDDGSLTAFERTNYEAGADAALRLNDWLGVNYAFSALKEPQIARDWQITNQLLLTFSYGFTRGPEDRAAAAGE